MFPRGPPQVLIAIVCYSLWLPSVTICQEPSFALVYVDIKPHMLCGKLKCTLSDSTAIPNHLYSLTKYLTMAHLLCLLVFKECVYLHVETFTMLHPTVNATRSIWHYNYGEPQIMLYSFAQQYTHEQTGMEALALLQCMSLTKENLDWGIDSLCNISLQGMPLVSLL